MNRKDFIGGVLSAAFLPSALASERARFKPEYHAFSRVFKFLKDPYKAAEFLKSCGYDGVEWTVRKEGFLDPNTVTADRMKALKSAADKAGIKAENIVVDFLRGDDPGAERLIMLAADAGFRSFRGDYLKYDRIIACGGSWMVAGNLVKNKEFDKIKELTKEAVSLVDEVSWPIKGKKGQAYLFKKIKSLILPFLSFLICLFLFF